MEKRGVSTAVRGGLGSLSAALIRPALTHTQEVFHQISEQGTQFSQRDYVNAFNLMSRSQLLRWDTVAGGRVTPAEHLEHALQQLDAVFSGDSV